MKKIYIATALIAVMILVTGFINYNKPAYTTIPDNAAGTGDVIDTVRFNDWIGHVTPVVDVFVKPADGPNFEGDNTGDTLSFDRQDFFRWSQQMFYWILSPVPANGKYGTCKGLVLNSPEFFDFNGNDLTYVRHRCDNLTKNNMSFEVKGTQNGPHNLPLFIEKETEKVYDVDKTPKSEKGYPLVVDENGTKIEVGNIIVNDKTPAFYDREGKRIDKVSLILGEGLDAKTTIQQFIIEKHILNISMDTPFNPIVIFPSQGQATLSSADTKHVLMSRSNNSLVYYNIMVNDVYVAFSKMVTDIHPTFFSSNSLFPTTDVELDSIKSYGSKHGIPIVDTDNRVLAMELKTSWVEATNLTNPEDYVKTVATIPNYVPDPTSTGTWIRNGTRTTTLALVGMHVVGSVKGHPEMIWSTFEHVNNTPNADGFDYTKNNGGTGNIATGLGNADFLFCESTANLISSFNVPHIISDLNFRLTGANNFIVSQSNTIRNQPFGWGGRLPSGGNPIPHNPVDILNVEDSNAQLIALNTDATNRLLTNDVRKKYFQVGATWSSKFKNNQQAGTIRLSNSTMETYTQAISNNIISTTGGGLNCFSCHNAGFGVVPFKITSPLNHQLSHVFGRTIAP